VGIVVQKYGGTSVADPERIKAVAEHVAFTRSHGNDVVVVVSAMGKTTDNLISLANQVSSTHPGRELDMLLTTGERISMALVCMALADIGIDAVSFTGSQVGIITDTVHTKAKILEVKGDRLREALAAGKVAVVAGFQGVSTDREITTLGRGGSDTTAVALAAAVNADVCEIYTDVTGVFSADPRIVPQARKLQRLDFEEMLEMAGAGSKVLALRSVEFARNHNVPLHVRSSFTWEHGTWVLDMSTVNAQQSSKENAMEDPIISGVVHETGEAKVTVFGVADKPGISAALFEPLADANVNVDMIVQNIAASKTHLSDISFTLPADDFKKAVQALEDAKAKIGFESLQLDEKIGKLSIVGSGMKTHSGVSATLFGALAKAGVNIEMISTSEIRISVVTDIAQVDDAARVVHTAFGLDGDGEAIIYAVTGR
jgi:aspartate kinase